jgi:hypothetical protein
VPNTLRKPIVFQFNWIHPNDYISNKYKSKGGETAFEEFILENNFGMTKIFTDELIKHDFQVFNYFFSDIAYLTDYSNKFRLKLNKNSIKYILNFSFKELYTFIRMKSKRVYFLAYFRLINEIIYFEPEFILIREPSGIDHSYLKKIRSVVDIKVISIIGCELKYIKNLLFNNYDMIFTLSDNYKQIFQTLSIPVNIFNYGTFDFNDIAEKQFQVVFVGDLYSEVQSSKAILCEHISKKINFKWWGPKNVNKEKYPNLFENYIGITAGEDMLKIYSSAKIIINDLPNNLKEGQNINFRTWESISSKSFSLNRYNKALDAIIQNANLQTYVDEDDCISKIEYYLTNNDEREMIADKVHDYCTKNYSFSNNFAELIKTIYK